MTLGQVNMAGTAAGLVVKQGPFVPILNSGINRIKVQGQGIAFNGTSFSDMSGNVDRIGTYSYTMATVDAYVNRYDPSASYIPDLEIAYCDDPTGNVFFSYDVVILYPTNPDAYSGFMAVEGANRGQATMCYLEDVPVWDLYSNTYPGISPSGISTPGTGCGNAFRYRQGDMIVYTGWEAGRPPSLSDAVVQYFASANNAAANVNSAFNCRPGQALASNISLSPQTCVGLGTTLPFCYSDLSFNEIMTGTCTDYGYFPTSSVNPSDRSTTSYVMYYPFMPNTLPTMTIAINKNGNIGTPIQVNEGEFSSFQGDGVAGRFSTPYSGYSRCALPIDYNTAYVGILRDSIMTGKNGQRMNTSNTANYTSYYPALQPDSNGNLCDYGSEYALTYTGFNTVPAVLGQFGIREIIGYLRYGTTSLFVNDAQGFWTGYQGKTKSAMLWGYEQSGEVARSFLYNGFNVTSSLTPVFDCCFFSQCGSCSRESDGYRFSKSNDENTQHFGPSTRSSNFPYTYESLQDPITDVVDGFLYKYVTFPNCNPKIYHVICPYDMFARRASLLLTDSLGKNLTILPNVRFFYLNGVPNKMTFSYSNVDMAAIRTPLEGHAQCDSEVAQSYFYRSCYFNLKEWVSTGNSPLDSVVPNPGNYTVEKNGFPNSARYGSVNPPDATLQTISSTLPDLLTSWIDFSNIVLPGNSNGLPWNGTQCVTAPNVLLSDSYNTQYPVYSPSYLKYQVLLPIMDGLGNDYAGLKTPEMGAPLMTVRGYNTYTQGYDSGDMVCLSSSAIPLSSNSSVAFSGDPRPTNINDLYGSCASWLSDWNNAVNNNITHGWMLSPSIFPYDNVCYTNRGTYQANLLRTVHGVPNV
jgi:hypothetical protein